MGSSMQPALHSAPPSRADAIVHGQRNYQAFYDRHLPVLLVKNRGEWAVLRDEEVVGLYPTREEALNGGAARYEDQRFSIQEVAEEEQIGLGWFSP